MKPKNPELQSGRSAKLLLPTSRTTDRIGWPWDLREWVSQDRLFNWIEYEIGLLDWQNPKLVAYLRAHPDYRPRVLLTLLTYGYATGVYGAEDIAEQCYADATFRRLCEQHPPSASSIIAFRRENRGLLRWCLTQVLRRALKEKYALDDGLMPPGLRKAIADAAVTRLDLARHLDRSVFGG